MKKYFIVLLSLMLIISALSSCTTLINVDSNPDTSHAENEADTQVKDTTKIDAEQVTEATDPNNSQATDSTDTTENTGLGMGASQGGGGDYTFRY